MAAISLLMSRVIVDELRTLEANQREKDAADADESASRLSRRRCSLAVERHAHLIQLYLMIELGYELPDLDELLLWVSQNPNPHRERLREQVQSGEFAFDRH
jgi:putative transposase